MQREPLLEGERRIRQGASKVVFTIQKLFIPKSVHDFPELLLSEFGIVSESYKLLGWINTCNSLAIAQDESGKSPSTQ